MEGGACHSPAQRPLPQSLGVSGLESWISPPCQRHWESRAWNWVGILISLAWVRSWKAPEFNGVLFTTPAFLSNVSVHPKSRIPPVQSTHARPSPFQKSTEVLSCLPFPPCCRSFSVSLTLASWRCCRAADPKRLRRWVLGRPALAFLLSLLPGPVLPPTPPPSKIPSSH